MARLIAAAALSVVCAAGAYRRAGHAFGKEPVVLLVDDLTDEQLESLQNDDQLQIEELDQLPEVEVDEAIIDPAQVQALRDEIERLTKVNGEHEQTIERMGKDLAKTIEERDAAQAKLAELTPPPANKPEGSEKPAATGEGDGKDKAEKPAKTKPASGQ